MPLTGTVAAGHGISIRGYCSESMAGIAYSALTDEITSFPFFIWKVTRSPSSRRSIPERSGAFTTTLPSLSICAGSRCSNAISRFPDATVSVSCSACKYAHCRISIVETLGAMRSAFCAAASSSVRLTMNFIAFSLLRNGIEQAQLVLHLLRFLRPFGFLLFQLHHGSLQLFFLLHCKHALRLFDHRG